MRLRVLVSCALCLVPFMPLLSAQQLLDRVLARIDTEAITQTDVETLVEFALIDTKSATLPAAIRQAIERQLALMEGVWCLSLGVRVLFRRGDDREAAGRENPPELAHHDIVIQQVLDGLERDDDIDLVHGGLGRNNIGREKRQAQQESLHEPFLHDSLCPGTARV